MIGFLNFPMGFCHFSRSLSSQFYNEPSRRSYWPALMAIFRVPYRVSFITLVGLFRGVATNPPVS